jgi:protein TonB
MKNLLVLILLATLPVCAGAQSKAKIIAYFDEHWRKVKDSNEAKYYRTAEKVNGKYLVKDYYNSGQLQMEMVCDEVEPKLKWDGPAVLYYQNGEKKEEGLFKDEERYGLHRYWYDNGKMHKVVFHKGKNTDVYHNFWSPDGVALLDRGNGFIQEKLGQLLLHTEVKDSLSIATFRIDASGDTLYLKLDKNAEYIGGLPAMTKDMKATLVYPKEARRTKVEGTVYVSFAVDKDGQVRDARVVKGIGAGCDEEAARAVMTLKQWQPGMHHGKLVNSAFVLPVKFNLKGWSFF